MKMIKTDGINPTKKLFHNELIDVYQSTLPIEEIHYWTENNRTIFTFEKLVRQKNGLPLKKIAIKDVTDYIAKQPIHKLEDLAKSIKRNGVQVPLIVLDDGTLLDGNRRYFACLWLKFNNKLRPEFLDNIPVWIIRSSDINPKTKLKILAEENFIQDLKLPWSLDAQARAVDDYYEEIKDEHPDEDAALTELVGVFGISKARIRDLRATLALTIEFIKLGKSDQDIENRRGIVEDKFVYFWEFLNKATKGNSRYTNSEELAEVKNVFFNLMALGGYSPIKNVKQIEPLAQSRRDKTAWALINEDGNGSQLPLVVSIMNDKKENRRADDKIRAFSSWLDSISEFSEGARNNLADLVVTIEKILGK